MRYNNRNSNNVSGGSDMMAITIPIVVAAAAAVSEAQRNIESIIASITYNEIMID